MLPENKYAEMKDSGIAWIGEIPKHWKIGRVKNKFVATKTIVGEDVDKYERLALTLNGVVKRSKIDSVGLQPERFETYQILRQNELVFKLIDLQNVSTSRVGRSPWIGIVSPAYIVLHQREDASTKYAEYFFLAMWMHQIFNQLGADGVRSNIGTATLLNLPYPLVPTNEQTAIVAYLDAECAKIDEIIAEAKASIDDYKQWKASIIYEAVTKGLDPHAEMKDSGVEWIGKIPQHWELIANKYVMRKQKRICEKWEKQDVLSLTMNGVIVRDIINHVGKMPTSFDGYQFAYKGELLMCLFDIDVTPRCIGRIFNDGVTSPAYSCFKLLNNANLDYFYYYYLMLDNTKELLHLAKNLRHSFTEEQLGQLKVPLPPIVEQKNIATFLDNYCTQIDGLVNEKQVLISELESYKKSLIYEAVTGKKRVCDIVGV